jgi:hypothetical protein
VGSLVERALSKEAFTATATPPSAVKPLMACFKWFDFS